MRRFAALILVLVLALSAVSAYAVSPADFLGIWYTGEVEDLGDVYLLTGDYHVEFRRDSTATLVMNGQAKEFTWKFVNGTTARLESAEDNRSFDFDYEDGELKAYIRDFSSEESPYNNNYVFSREQPEIFVVPGILAAEKEEDFFGDWKADFSVTDKGIAKATEEEAALGIRVEFAQIMLTEGDNVSYALTEYVDGKLRFNGSDLNLQDAAMIVELAENGHARITVDGKPAEEYNYYLVKIDADAEKPAATEEETKSE